MAAGENQQVDNAQLSDELLQTVIPFMFVDPDEGEVIWLVPSAPWPFRVKHLKAKSTDGEYMLNLTANDGQMELSEVSSGAYVNSAGYARADAGNLDEYEVVGDTDEDDPRVDTGQSLKITVEEKTETGGPTVIGQVLVERIRNDVP